MDLKEEYNSIVDFLKASAKNADGSKMTKEDIAKRLNFSRGHLSKLLGGKDLKQYHLDQIKAVFKEEISGKQPDANSNEEIVQAATIKMLFNEVAKLKSKINNQKFSDAITDMEQSTTSIMIDMLKEIEKVRKK